MPRWTRLTNSLSLRDRGPISYSRGRLARHAFACARPHGATGCNCLSCRHRQRGGRLLRLGRDLCAAPTADDRENPRHDPHQFGRTRPLGRQIIRRDFASREGRARIPSCSRVQGSRRTPTFRIFRPDFIMPVRRVPRDHVFVWSAGTSLGKLAAPVFSEHAKPSVPRP